MNVEVEYKINRKNNQFTIRTLTETELINTYAAPSKKHPLEYRWQRDGYYYPFDVR